ncbi:MAG TPA: proton-conducting transporter membrane subunit, partial [Blastocatellia bacterium]|nr:proton-conducting transporter membrane subunit [Blastocatellia bacterium]
MFKALLSGFTLSLAAPWIYRLGRDATGWLRAILPLGLFLYFASFASRVAAGETFAVSYPWVAGLDINLSFYVDGLSLMFALLICGIGALVVVYSGGYLAGHAYLGRFYSFLLMFMASMLGLVLADNLITLFVFWELTSLSSYLLIGFDHESERSRAAALQALLVTGGGGLALMAGLVMLGLIGGSFEMSVLLNRGDAVRSHALYLPALLLVLAGAFTKSAQFPFHFWLPAAMEAPTPVSAYLHSATMVKAGIYLMARLSPVLGGTEAWHYTVTIAGAATMLIGGYLALNKTDLKQILAYSTVSALGTLTLLLGIGTEGAVKAAMVFLLAHALYKGALFMIAGAVDHETGTRDVEQLGGLRQVMPITAAAALLAALSLAGLGPFLSFIGKEMLFEAVWESRQARAVLAPAAVIAGAMFVAVAAIVVVRPFFGRLKETPRRAHEAPLSLWLGPALLSIKGLLIGIFPGLAAAWVISPSVAAVLKEPSVVVLSLWHGLNPALVMSAIAFVLGLLIYYAWKALRRTSSKLDRLFGWGPASWYSLLLDGVGTLALAQTRVLQSGYLSFYLLI